MGGGVPGGGMGMGMGMGGGVPIDGGIGFLLASGVIYGAKKVYDMTKEND